MKRAIAGVAYGVQLIVAVYALKYGVGLSLFCIFVLLFTILKVHCVRAGDDEHNEIGMGKYVIQVGNAWIRSFLLLFVPIVTFYFLHPFSGGQTDLNPIAAAIALFAALLGARLMTKTYLER